MTRYTTKLNQDHLVYTSEGPVELKAAGGELTDAQIIVVQDAAWGARLFAEGMVTLLEDGPEVQPAPADAAPVAGRGETVETPATSKGKK